MKKIKKSMNEYAGFFICTALAVTSFFECMTLRVLLILIFMPWVIYNLIKIILPEETKIRKKQPYNGTQLKYPVNIQSRRRQSDHKLRYGKKHYADAGQKKPVYTIRKFNTGT